MAPTVAPLVNTLTPKFILAAISARDNDEQFSKNYLYRTLMPLRPVAENELTWSVRREQNLLAGIYSMDGRPVPAPNIDYEQAFASIARIMANRILDETSVMTLKSLNELSAFNTNPVVASAAARHQSILRDHIVAINDQIESQLEYFFWGAMQGEISWPPRDVDGNLITPKRLPYWGSATMTVTLPFPAEMKQAATTLDVDGEAGTGVAWDDYANADILNDLEKIQTAINNSSSLDTSVMNVLCSRQVLKYFTRNARLITLMRGDSGPAPAGTLTEAEIRNWMMTNLGLNFQFYDKVWTYEAAGSNLSTRANIVKVRYLPVGRMIFYPQGADLGYMATSPAKGPDAAWNTGKFAWVSDQPIPPFITEIGAGINAFPVNQRWDSIFVFDANK